MFEDFDASAWDIDGLTDYEPQVLPAWLRSRLDEMFGALEETPADWELAEQYIDDGRNWLGGWGTAKIGGEPVLICEAEGVDCECFEAAYVAEMIQSGLVFVEPSDRFAVGATLYFTEGRQCAKRKGACLGAETRGALPSCHPSAAPDLASFSAS